MRRPPLASVAAAVLLAGCATRTVAPPRDVAPLTGRVVVAAPAGPASEGTGEIAAEIARLTGFGLESAASGRRGVLDVYVEIAGSERREAADLVEVATAGVDADEALKLRTLFELVRDAHLRTHPHLRLSVRVEPADGAARAGLGRLAARTLRIELPRVARRQGRELYAMILADFLREAVALPLPARR